jgi:TrmH family RNA methyltransferase
MSFGEGRVGKSHPKIRYLRALRRDRGMRDADRVYVAEGIHLATEALQASAPIELAVIAARLAQVDGGPQLRRRLEASRAELLEVADDVLDGIQDARSPQPVVVLLRRAALTLEEVVPGRAGVPLVVVAHGIQDPGTLGTLLRSADAAGATGCAVTGDGADLYHPRTVRATMGALFRLPAAAFALESVLARARSTGIALVATAARSGSACHAFDLRQAVAVVFGSEGAGLSAEVRHALGATVHVPMRAQTDSLSVAAAAAVILFEAARQRDPRPA